MQNPDKRIVDFINEHHVLTLATSVKNNPWCANCFYTYLEDENCFVFTSNTETKHIQNVLENSKIAGTVVLETNTVGKIQGIQFQGKMDKPEKHLASKAKKAYLKKFPFTVLMKTTLWVVHPVIIKMTDNRLGFGKKLIWEKAKKFS
jgi:uncharacterized protein YhbP (UPF0306 family)